MEISFLRGSDRASQQSRYIRAGDEQHESDRRHQHDQHRLYLPTIWRRRLTAPSSRLHSNPDIAMANRLDKVCISALCLLQADPRLQASHRMQPVAISPQGKSVEPG